MISFSAFRAPIALLMLVAAGVATVSCRPHTPPKCGNGVCDAAPGGLGETLDNCRVDCEQLCGNDTCEEGERKETCPQDCKCGDRVCRPEAGETVFSCPVDCVPTLCGNGTCDWMLGENKTLCPADCHSTCCTDCCTLAASSGCAATLTCGPGPDCSDACFEEHCFDHQQSVCESTNGENADNCPSDCHPHGYYESCEESRSWSGMGEDFWCRGFDCWDGVCDRFQGETANACRGAGDYAICAGLATCGGGYCDHWDETVVTCPQDCTVCGDGVCYVPYEGNGRPGACAVDCGCGDNACDPTIDETPESCPEDCHCGDNVCTPEAPQSETTGNCPHDCTCGNGYCEWSIESRPAGAWCPADCDKPDICGNGICEAIESADSCPPDCQNDAGVDAGTDAGTDAGADAGGAPGYTWARIYPPAAAAGAPDGGGIPANDGLDGRLLRAIDGGFVAIVDAPAFSTAPQTPFVVTLNPSGAVVWARHLGFDPASIADVVEAPDGGFAVLGTVNGAPGSGFSRVVRIDASGSVLWEKQLDSANPHTPRSIEALPAGGYLVLLRTPGGAVLDSVVVRLDEAGDVLWAKRQGTLGFEHHPSTLHRTSDDGFIISGARGAMGAGDGWVAKLDAAGDMVWQRVFAGGFGVAMHDAIEAADGGYLAVGEMTLRRGTLSPPVPSAAGPLLVRLDAAGAPLWQQTYANATPFEVSQMSAVQMPSGFVVLVNEPASALLAVDGAGAVLWERTYAAGASSGSKLSSVQASRGGLAVAGTSAQRAWLLQLDPDGRVAPGCPATVAADVSGVTAATAALTSSAPAAVSSVVTFGATVTSSPAGAGPGSASELVCGM